MSILGIVFLQEKAPEIGAFSEVFSKLVENTDICDLQVSIITCPITGSGIGIVRIERETDTTAIIVVVVIPVVVIEYTGIARSVVASIARPFTRSGVGAVTI